MYLDFCSRHYDMCANSEDCSSSSRDNISDTKKHKGKAHCIEATSSLQVINVGAKDAAAASYCCQRRYAALGHETWRDC